MITPLRPASIPDLPLARPVAEPASAGIESTNFASLLADIFNDAGVDLRRAETTAAAGLRGDASVQQVVESLMNAERSLQVATTMRDKAVSAYQEFARMAI